VGWSTVATNAAVQVEMESTSPSKTTVLTSRPSAPHAITDPSFLSPAKPPLTPQMISTPPEKSTEELSPPLLATPHVTTDPSSLSAANAELVETTSATPPDKSTPLLLPPQSCRPHVTTDPSFLSAANALPAEVMDLTLPREPLSEFP
jgi:hypothetical protein